MNPAEPANSGFRCGRPRVLVCGTGFGRVYLAAVADPASPFELAGILAKGSARSHACAARYGVPLYERPDHVPADIELACVVVGSAINGGQGAQLAGELMARGVHVLQEHPVHRGELAECLRTARRHGVRYQVNSHHVHVAPVRRFIAAARALLRIQQALFIDLATSVQVLYTAFDIIGRALGRLRPYGFDPPAEMSSQVSALTRLEQPFRSLPGVLGGIPVTLRVQHQMDPREPDNHAHLWHRIMLGTEGGTLTLVSSVGPVLWCPRPHLPAAAATRTGLDAMPETHLGFPVTVAIGPSEAPSWASTLSELWPAAVRTALTEFYGTQGASADPMVAGQYHLALSELIQQLAGRLGPAALVRRAEPAVLSVADIIDAATKSEREVIGLSMAEAGGARRLECR